ncbi:putative transcriptional regulator [Pseudomonas aeruginosa PA38182]|nr:putative transcriptional regulator [Pseudomonas aeruginosa PA38182]
MSQDFWFLLLPGFSVMGFVSAVEPLRVANRFHADLYRWHVLSADGGPVLASNGMSVNSDGALEPLKKGDLLFVVAGFEPLRAVTPALVQWLRKLDRNGVTLGGIDTGSVVLAEAGLLDGRRATLHWEAIDAFQESYPQLSVTQELFEIDGPRITSAGGTASIDLMLDLIAQAHGPQLAVQVSEQFVLGRIRPRQDHQRLQVATRYGVSNRKLVQVIGEMERHTEPPLTTLELAERIQVTRRQLERLFRVHLDDTPSNFYLGLRLDKARQLLRQTDLSVLQVSLACGFESPSYFSRSYRARFAASLQPGSRGAAAQGSRSHAARRASRASHASS